MLACSHHHCCGSQPASANTSNAIATLQAPSAIQRSPGSRRGCRLAACTIAAQVIKSNIRRSDRSMRVNGSTWPNSTVDSIAISAKVPVRQNDITAYSRLRRVGRASTTTIATRYRVKAAAASSQNVIGRLAKPRRLACTWTLAPSEKLRLKPGSSWALKACSCRVVRRARCPSSVSQRVERCSASTSEIGTDRPPATKPVSILPTCGLRAGLEVPISSTWSTPAPRQTTPMCGCSAMP